MVAKAKTRKGFEEAVLRYLREWSEFLGLDKRWIINYAFVEHLSDGTQGAEVTVESPYPRATITFSYQLHQATLEHHVLHELLHIELKALQRESTRAIIEERCDFFARQFLRLKYGKKFTLFDEVIPTGVHQH